jgi:hypothetical protein
LIFYTIENIQYLRVSIPRAAELQQRAERELNCSLFELNQWIACSEQLAWLETFILWLGRIHIQDLQVFTSSRAGVKTALGANSLSPWSGAQGTHPLIETSERRSRRKWGP